MKDAEESAVDNNGRADFTGLSIPYFDVNKFLPILNSSYENGGFPDLAQNLMKIYDPDDKNFVRKINALKGGSVSDQFVFLNTMTFLQEKGFLDSDYDMPGINLREDQLRHCLEHDFKRNKENSVLGYFGITTEEASSMPASFLEDVVGLMRSGDLEQQESYQRLYKHAQTLIESERNTLEKRAQSAVLSAEKSFREKNYALFGSVARTSRETSEY